MQGWGFWVWAVLILFFWNRKGVKDREKTPRAKDRKL